MNTPGRWRVSGTFKAVLSAIGWLSIIATTGLLDGNPSWQALEMFTTQSNILAAACFTVASARLLTGRDDARPPFAPAWKGIATMGVAVTFLVAWLVLRMGVSFDSFAGASLLGLHFAVPLLAVADWLIFDPSGLLGWRDPLIWLAAPMAYLVEFAVVLAAGGSLGAGGAIGTDGPGDAASRAPYPFLDVDALGLGAVTLNVLALAAAIVALGYVAVALDRATHVWRKSRRGAWPPS